MVYRALFHWPLALKHIVSCRKFANSLTNHNKSLSYWQISFTIFTWQNFHLLLEPLHINTYIVFAQFIIGRSPHTNPQGNANDNLGRTMGHHDGDCDCSFSLAHISWGGAECAHINRCSTEYHFGLLSERSSIMSISNTNKRRRSELLSRAHTEHIASRRNRRYY